MKLQILCLCAAIGASAQNVVSQLGGFTEQVGTVPVQVAATPPNPLSLFLQQDPSLPVPGIAAVFDRGADFGTAPAGPATPARIEQALPPSFPVTGAITPVFDWVPAAAALPEPVQPAGLTLRQPFARPKGLLTLRSLRVANMGPEGSKVFFGTGSAMGTDSWGTDSGAHSFAMGTDSAGNFIVQQASAAAPLINLDSQNTLHLGSARVEAQALNAVNGISVRGVKQWQLVYIDDFSSGASGWSRPESSECGGVFMLGGFCKFSTGEVNKTYAGLPPHKQLRVVAKYHFIDRWIGETGYMKLDIGMNDCMVPVWSEQHKEDGGKNGINLCGDAGTPEGKFSVPVEVTVKHHTDSVSVAFGATVGGDPCDESWGISAVEIYTRN